MKFLTDTIKGIVVGVANVIPGVSGGTMMVTMGIYEKIIGAVNTLFQNLKQSILTLLPIGIGLLLGIAGSSYLIPFCLEKYPVPTCLCFIGLILGGVPGLYKQTKESLVQEQKKFSVMHGLVFLAFFAVAVWMAGLNEQETNPAEFELNIWLVVLLFLIGVIAAATMVVPGVSGSLVLMILGFYSGIMSSISGFISAVLHFDVPNILHNMGILVPFGLGVLTGIFAVAKLIEWLFARFRSVTLCGIMGLIIASPVAILLKQGKDIPLIIGLVLLIAGAYFTYWFGKKTEGIE